MSIIEEIKSTLDGFEIPVETSVFSNSPLESYLVITPLSEVFSVYADNLPRCEVQEAQISLFSRKNYIKLKNRLVRRLLAAGFVISTRRYVGFENDTRYHHYAIDVKKEYKINYLEEELNCQQ